MLHWNVRPSNATGSWSPNVHAFPYGDEGVFTMSALNEMIGRYTPRGGCDGFFCTVPQVTPHRRRACWIAVFLTHGRHEQHERADENGGSPTPLEPFAPVMLRNLAGCRTFRHTLVEIYV